MKKHEPIRPFLGAAIVCVALCVVAAPIVRVQTATPLPAPATPPKKGDTTLLTTDAQVPTPTLRALRGALKADKKTLKAGEPVTFTYSVTNTSKTNPLLVNFSSGQRFDLLITPRNGGVSVWQMSRSQMFTMALGTVAFAPGETKTFTATWKPAPSEIKRGASYGATAFLTPLIKEKPSTEGVDNTRYAHANLPLTAAK